MTRTWPSTPAGTDPRAAALASWLRRAAGEPAASAWVLRGSIVTAALCPGARPPADVDYLVPGDHATFDPDALARIVHATVARPDPGPLAIVSTEVIFEETRSPGLRAHLAAGALPFQIDLAVGDPMCAPPRPLAIADVGDVRACAPETLFGWKLHGLCEYGPGKWRAKDLYDLDLLWRHAALDVATCRETIALAFSSRDLPLSALDDFRHRPTWGLSRGGVRKWRAFRTKVPAAEDFTVVRERVRAAVATLLDPA